MDSTIEIIPKVSVLMPVFNCEKFIEEAVDSILNQTFTDFEFIIIDDASTDDTVKNIKTYKDPRIQLIEKPENTGHTKSLNYGLSIAKGQYIARMDGDDISLPNRFEKQVEFLDNNSGVIVCGTFYKILNSNEIKKHPEKHEVIKINLLNKTPFGHPTVMMRRNILRENNITYDENFKVAQDYELWTRLINYGRFHNLPIVLLKYRVHGNQVSKTNLKIKTSVRNDLKYRMLSYLNLDLDQDQKILILKIIHRDKPFYYPDFLKFQELKSIFVQGNSADFFNATLFKQYLRGMEYIIFKDYFLRRNQHKPKYFYQYWKLKKKLKFSFNNTITLIFFIKSISYFKESKKYYKCT